MKRSDNIILHLSDLHFSTKLSGIDKVNSDSVLEELTEILKTVDWKPTIICITGDIVDKYDIGGFALAKIWIKNLAEILSVPMERILICPGNHDCSRDILICPEINVSDSQKADQILSYPIPDYLLKRFSQYNNFCQELGIVPYKFMGEESYLVGTRIIDNICFWGCNSEWFSFHDKSELWLGKNYLEQMKQQDSQENSDIRIAIMHHGTESDFAEKEKGFYEDRRPALRYLWSLCNMLLFGHTHEGAIGKPSYMESNCWSVRAGATNINEKYPNNVNLLKIQSDGFELRHIIFSPAQLENRWTIEQPKKKNFWKMQTADLEKESCFSADRIRKLMKDYVQEVIENKVREINCPPNSLKQEKLKVRLERIHKELLNGKEERNSKSDLTSLYNVIENNKKVLLFGELGMGKSTLMAQTVIDVLENGEEVIPVFVPAKALISADENSAIELREEINRFLIESFLLENTFQEMILNAKKVFLFIDGLDEISITHIKILLRQIERLMGAYRNLAAVISTRVAEIGDINISQWTVCEMPPLDMDQRKRMLLHEAEAHGKVGKEKDIFVQKSMSIIRKNPSIYGLSNTPLSIRLLYKSFDSNLDIEKLTVGDLLFELLKMRAAEWSELDLKDNTNNNYLAAFPTDDDKIYLVGRIAYEALSNEVLSVKSAKVIVKSLIQNQMLNNNLVADEAIKTLIFNGLISTGDRIRFTYHPLAQVAAGYYIAEEIINERLDINQIPVELWREIAFAGSILRNWKVFPKYKEFFKNYITKLPCNNNNIIYIISYICSELMDEDIAVWSMECVSKVGFRPLWYYERERKYSVTVIAKMIVLAGDKGTNWLIDEYLDLRIPLINRGSRFIHDFLEQWVVLVKGRLNNEQKEKLKRIIRVLSFGSSVAYFSVREVLCYLLPEEYEVADRLDCILRLACKEEFYYWGQKQFCQMALSNKTICNSVLENSDNSISALYWLKINDNEIPPVTVLKNLLRYVYDGKDKINEDSRIFLEKCIDRIGHSRWKIILRRIIAEGDKAQAAAAVELVKYENENLFFIAKALTDGMVNAPAHCIYEQTMELVVHMMKKENIEWSEILFDRAYFVAGASSGCYRIFLKYLLDMEEVKVDLFMGCIKHIGPYTLPRYAEIRELFVQILKRVEYRSALIKALDSYDGKIREAASMILAACDKNDNGNALVMTILGMHDGTEYNEWHKFLASQKYSDIVLKHLLEMVDSLMGEQRILALVILAYNGVKITEYNKEEVVAAKSNWKYFYINEIDLSDFELSDENVFRKLYEQEKEDNIEYDVARTLLCKYYDKLCLEGRVKCILSVWANGSIPNIEEIIINMSHPEFGSLFSKYRENYSQSKNYKILKCFNFQDELCINWKELVWEIFCNDIDLVGMDKDEIGLQWLLLGRKNSVYGKAMGEEIRKVIDDDRLQKDRWLEKYQWLLILVDEFTDYDKKILAEHVHMDREIMYETSSSLIWRLGEELLTGKIGINEKEIRKKKRIRDINLKLLDTTKESELLQKDIFDIVFEKAEKDEVLEDSLLIDIEEQGKNGVLIGAMLRYIYGRKMTVEAGFECNKIFFTFARVESREFQKILSCVRTEFSYKIRYDLEFQRQYNELIMKKMQNCRDDLQNDFVMYEFTKMNKKGMTIEQLEKVLMYLFGFDSMNMYGILTMKNVLPIIKSVSNVEEKEKILETVYRCLLKNEYSSDNEKIFKGNSFCDMALVIVYWWLKGDVTDFGMKLFANGMIKFFYEKEKQGLEEKEKSFMEKYEEFIELIEFLTNEMKEKILLKLYEYPLLEVRVMGKLLKGI